MQDDVQTKPEQSWKDRQKDQLRHELITTALQLFKEKNGEAPSVDEITARTGVAKGTFYLYFKTKSDIMAAILEHALEQLESRINSALASAPVDAPQAFRAVLQAQVSFLGEQPAVMPMLLGNESALMDQLDSDSRSVLGPRCKAATVQVYERILRTGILQRHYREVDPVLAARGLQGMLAALIKEAMESGTALGEATDVMMDLFERGISRSGYQR